MNWIFGTVAFIKIVSRRKTHVLSWQCVLSHEHTYTYLSFSLFDVNATSSVNHQINFPIFSIFLPLKLKLLKMNTQYYFEIAYSIYGKMKFKIPNKIFKYLKKKISFFQNVNSHQNSSGNILSGNISYGWKFYYVWKKNCQENEMIWFFQTQ